MIFVSQSNQTNTDTSNSTVAIRVNFYKSELNFVVFAKQTKVNFFETVFIVRHFIFFDVISSKVIFAEFYTHFDHKTQSNKITDMNYIII